MAELPFQYCIVDDALSEDEYAYLLSGAESAGEDEEGANYIRHSSSYEHLLNYYHQHFGETSPELLSAVLVSLRNTNSNCVHRHPNENTIIFYLCREWEINWGGELLLIGSDLQTIERAIEYRPNRLVMLGSAIYHVVRSPTPNTDRVRRALVLRFREE